MTVHRFLATAPVGPRMDMWAATAACANWLEGRENGDRGETWLVMVPSDHAEDFVTAGAAAGVTVEEIQGDGDEENYVLRAGEPGTGWRP
ncbi:hypothetical protein AB0M87_04575 [Streptomyces sp. NPDC051320]|uniref:hypothetical protein n=1 Tax=Streptomyces sp. NPDC051320 TaxID=3154644 RepID=UPI00343CD066